MNCLQNILADFQKLVLKSEEKPSSYELQVFIKINGKECQISSRKLRKNLLAKKSA